MVFGDMFGLYSVVCIIYFLFSSPPALTTRKPPSKLPVRNHLFEQYIPHISPGGCGGESCGGQGKERDNAGFSARDERD